MIEVQAHLHTLPSTYNSWGNGSAMRVSPVGFASDSLDAVLAKAKATAEITHNHQEGIRGAQATASAIFLGRIGQDKSDIKGYVQTHFGYDLDRKRNGIRPGYSFDISCQGPVPKSLIASLESSDSETAVRNAVSLDGDADTMACIAGGTAEAYYGGVPEPICQETLDVRGSRRPSGGSRSRMWGSLHGRRATSSRQDSMGLNPIPTFTETGRQAVAFMGEGPPRTLGGKVLRNTERQDRGENSAG